MIRNFETRGLRGKAPTALLLALFAASCGTAPDEEHPSSTEQDESALGCRPGQCPDDNGPWVPDPRPTPPTPRPEACRASAQCENGGFISCDATKGKENWCEQYTRKDPKDRFGRRRIITLRCISVDPAGRVIQDDTVNCIARQ